jgi:hypothetical protein
MHCRPPTSRPSWTSCDLCSIALFGTKRWSVLWRYVGHCGTSGPAANSRGVCRNRRTRPSSRGLQQDSQPGFCARDERSRSRLSGERLDPGTHRRPPGFANPDGSTAPSKMDSGQRQLELLVPGRLGRRLGGNVGTLPTTPLSGPQAAEVRHSVKPSTWTGSGWPNSGAVDRLCSRAACRVDGANTGFRLSTTACIRA